MSSAAASAPFRVGIVPGVTIAKWTRRWQERHPDAPLEVVVIGESEQMLALRHGRVDVGFVRFSQHRLQRGGNDGLSIIPLYQEQPVVVVPRDHAVVAVDSVLLADLDGEVRQEASDSVRDAVELVAAGVGVLVVPQSLARLHARKDVTYRPVTDAAPTQIALAWLAESTTAQVEEFVGIVRGRTAHSSRTTPTPPKARKPATRAVPRKPVDRAAARAAKARRRRGR